MDPELVVLFMSVLKRVRQESWQARAAGDLLLSRFWDGSERVLLDMMGDLADHPRPAPEVWAYLVRESRP